MSAQLIAENSGSTGGFVHLIVFNYLICTALWNRTRDLQINNVRLGKYGRYRTNVWTYPGVNSFGANRGDLELHPTVKPVALVADAIRDCSHRQGIVLDAFAGSGTTLVAAEKTGRIACGIEIDPHYCDVILHRMREVCGLDVVLEASGQAFTKVADDRAEQDALEGARPLAEECTA